MQQKAISYYYQMKDNWDKEERIGKDVFKLTAIKKQPPFDDCLIIIML